MSDDDFAKVRDLIEAGARKTLERAEREAEVAPMTKERRGMGKLKVYSGCFDGSLTAVVAAPNAAAAARAFDVTPYLLRTYGVQTGNDVEVAAAMQEPGVVFSAPNNTNDFIRGYPRWRPGQPWPPHQP